MSLINDVLQDLDQRGLAGKQPGPLQFATISDADHHTNIGAARDRSLRQVGQRFPLELLVIATTLAGIVIGFGLHAVGSPNRSAEPQSELPFLAEMGPTTGETAETATPLRAVADRRESGPARPTATSSKPSSILDKALALSATSKSDSAPIAPTQPTSRDPVGPVLATVTAGSTENAPASPEQANAPAVEPRFITLRNAVEPPRAAKAGAPKQVAKSRSRFTVTKSHATRPLADAQRAIESDDLALAEQLLQRHLDRVPGDRLARELLIGLMLRNERYPAAIEHLDQGLAQAPRHAKFALIKARLLAQAGDRTGALLLLESLPQSHEGRIEAAQMLGALYQQQGRYADAVASYRELLGLKPNYGPAWVGYAISLDGTGDAAALAAYRRALRLGGVPAAAAQYAQKRIAQLAVSRD